MKPLACLLALAAASAWAAPQRVTLLLPDDDPRLERARVERVYFGHPTGAAQDGLQMALKDSQLELDAAGSSLALDVVSVASPEAAKAAAQKAEKAGALALVTDLPAAWTLAAADGAKLPVLNVGNPEDRLREADCRPRLFHLIPSERMRADAIGQTLASQRWQQVLLLTGPSADDQRRSAVVQAAIKRYGLKLAGSKPFKLSADPRERDLANPRLLTGGSYDVVWVVDSDGEFARSLPYRTVLPRPVVGDAGLTALGWHAQFERFGAPQVSRRFARNASGRTMQSSDWAAWMAGKALAAAVLAAPKGKLAEMQAALAQVELDGSKGVPMSFRSWDGQLRQRLLMTDGQGVVAMAPVDGVLHPKNVLDTLGADQAEKLCKARGG
ncbi:ABC transporter substrate-binding protein [Ideonella sp. 4Y11]|uniref:ABC transporter substrate-binding protein n=1 Tax=Ideonella aquatica TaxID=2824119 RepID=A0A940YHM6_9BURK|nr:ABC transporter substrate-binding protein [Ideonella aquatica]MBQ0958907.1 ABC transporter substrate-binding protein [Ideonella aquatica]